MNDSQALIFQGKVVRAEKVVALLDLRKNLKTKIGVIYNRLHYDIYKRFPPKCGEPPGEIEDAIVLALTKLHISRYMSEYNEKELDELIFILSSKTYKRFIAGRAKASLDCEYEFSKLVKDYFESCSGDVPIEFRRLIQKTSHKIIAK